MKDMAVIFDMDGIIIDSEPIHIELGMEVYKRLQIDVPLETHYKFIGGSINRKWQILKETYNIPLTLSEFKELQREVYGNHKINYKNIMCEGVTPLLVALHNEQLKIGLASSSGRDKITQVLTECEIGKYFDSIVSGEELKESKPNPEIFLLSASKLGVKPENCVVIEDSFNGITAAKRAGMRVIAVKHKTIPMDLSTADKVVHSLTEVDLGVL